MELDLVLFVLFLIAAPAHIFLIGYRESNRSDDNQFFMRIFNASGFFVFILAVYLAIFSNWMTLLVLSAVIGINLLIYKKFIQVWGREETSVYKKIFINVTKVIVVIIVAYATFVVVATTLGLYMYYYKELIRETDPNVQVNACRVDSESCYKLKAYYVREACAPVDYGTRGQSGGQCYRDAYIEKIYFENGGYITFESDDCNIVNDESWSCIDSNGDGWNIEITEK